MINGEMTFMFAFASLTDHQRFCCGYGLLRCLQGLLFSDYWRQGNIFLQNFWIIALLIDKVPLQTQNLNWNYLEVLSALSSA